MRLKKQKLMGRWKSKTDLGGVVSQILWCFLKGRYKRPLISHSYMLIKKKNRTDEILCFCSLDIPMEF